jgi:hypothetical protein
MHGCRADGSGDLFVNIYAGADTNRAAKYDARPKASSHLVARKSGALRCAPGTFLQVQPLIDTQLLSSGSSVVRVSKFASV